MNVSDLAYLVLVAVALAIALRLVIAFADRCDQQKQRRQRPIGFFDELEAFTRQRDRKRQVVHQLRATAQQAQRSRGDRP